MVGCYCAIGPPPMLALDYDLFLWGGTGANPDLYFCLTPSGLFIIFPALPGAAPFDAFLRTLKPPGWSIWAYLGSLYMLALWFGSYEFSLFNPRVCYIGIMNQLGLKWLFWNLDTYIFSNFLSDIRNSMLISSLHLVACWTRWWFHHF